ncbi:(4Fe-4S)-binding protein [Phytoactinopolyspora limicola]|uniref:(4Fe-4S)-binding protein n=1 Tax=Phytoactinopolyspora limicola TaxID=2715536 RepID=UPI00140D27F2
MRINADREVCIGAGMCVFAAPDVFDQDENNGRVELRSNEPESVDVARIHEAIELCPSGALSALD